MQVVGLLIQTTVLWRVEVGGQERIDSIDHTSETWKGSHDIISRRLTRSLRQRGQGCMVLHFEVPTSLCNHHPGCYPEHCQLNLLEYEIHIQLMDNLTSLLGFPYNWFQDKQIAVISVSPGNLLPVWTWIRSELSQSAFCVQTSRHQQFS
jgi:hypothetical protein